MPGATSRTRAASPLARIPRRRCSATVGAAQRSTAGSRCCCATTAPPCRRTSPLERRVLLVRRPSSIGRLRCAVPPPATAPLRLLEHDDRAQHLAALHLAER